MRIRTRLLALSLMIAALLSLTAAASAHDERLEAMKTTARRFFMEYFTNDQTALLTELVADDFVYSSPLGTFDQMGFSALVGAFEMAIPDKSVSLELILADGDLLVTRHVFRGTFSGSFVTPNRVVEPNGQPIQVYAHAVLQLNADGEIARVNEFFDLVTLYSQLGVIPMQAGAGDVSAAADMPISEWMIADFPEEFQVMTREHFPINTLKIVLEDTAANAPLYLADDFQWHSSPADPSQVFDRDAFVANLTGLRAAIPDYAVELGMTVVEGDYAAITLTGTGTFLEPFSLPGGQTALPTGQPVALTVHTIMRFGEDGRAVEEWDMLDNLAYGIAFGLIPPM
ncbi:MAG: ester cyclase [Anaerolineae bacterium]|nr:ester cyclase [Anaerolineae bacterium]